MAFPARFAGRCVCGTEIVVGQMIAKNADGRFVHSGCLNAQAPAPTVYRHAASGIEVWAAAGIVAVASMDGDRATRLNGVGFNRQDGDFGHAMADKIVAGRGLTDRMWSAVVKLANKYHRQIAPKPGTVSEEVASDSCDRAEAELARREWNRDNAEYNAGVAEARAYQDNVRMLGQDYADAIEIEREMRFGDGY